MDLGTRLGLIFAEGVQFSAKVELDNIDRQLADVENIVRDEMIMDCAKYNCPPEKREEVIGKHFQNLVELRKAYLNSARRTILHDYYEKAESLKARLNKFGA